jgi:hypothetical protein
VASFCSAKASVRDSVSSSLSDCFSGVQAPRKKSPAANTGMNDFKVIVVIQAEFTYRALIHYFADSLMIINHKAETFFSLSKHLLQ